MWPGLGDGRGSPTGPMSDMLKKVGRAIAVRRPQKAGGSRVGLHRGLAIVLVVLGALYVALGNWLATGHGPATSAFEAVRRYDVALTHGRYALAASLGEEALAVALGDRNWSAPQIAAFEAELAETELAGHRIAEALDLVRSASKRLEALPATRIALVIEIAQTHARVASAAGNDLEAVCTYGVLLEQLGPDRVAQVEGNQKATSEIADLARDLTEIGTRLKAPAAALPPNVSAHPLTSCQLLADFYVERKDYKAAAAASDIVVAAARSDTRLAPEMRSALLQGSGHIHELVGDVQTAEARLNEAVEVLGATSNTGAKLHALETLGTFLSNWGESERALPVLERTLALQEADGERQKPRLASTLLALGYAQLDAADAAAAETSFKRAYALSSAEDTSSPPATREALTALGDLYQDQGREIDAIHAKEAAAAVEVAPTFDAGRKLAEAQRTRAETVRVLTLRIPFRAAGTPASGRVSEAFSVPTDTKSTGEVSVVLAAPVGIDWAARWPKDRFERVAPSPALYGTGAPEAAEGERTRQAAVLFFPGEGTDFAANAERTARLQAELGPDTQVILGHWASRRGPLGYLKNDLADAYARSLMSDLLGEAARVPEGPVSIVAEGRAARSLAETFAFDLVPASVQERISALVFIAPLLGEKDMVSFGSRFDPKRTRLTVYAAQGARPLLAARAVYRAEPIGLRATPIPGLKRAEWIEIGIGEAAADFDTMASDALMSDIGAVVRGGPPAAKRCALARVSEARAGDAYALNPAGCEGGPAGASK